MQKFSKFTIDVIGIIKLILGVIQPNTRKTISYSFIKLLKHFWGKFMRISGTRNIRKFECSYGFLFFARYKGIKRVCNSEGVHWQYTVYYTKVPNNFWHWKRETLPKNFYWITNIKPGCSHASWRSYYPLDHWRWRQNHLKKWTNKNAAYRII
jgi:hypothetical protein